MIVEIYGEIGWWPNTLEGVKEKIGNNTPERVDIFSPAGDVFEGLAIADFVNRMDVPTRGVGFVGSIATAILMAGNRVGVTEDTILFFHRPLFESAFYIDAPEVEKMKEQLAAIEKVLVGIYARQMIKNGVSESEAERIARNLIESDTFLTASEAKELGLVDAIEQAAGIVNSNNMVLRAVAKFNDMKLIDQIKAKLGIVDEQGVAVSDDPQIKNDDAKTQSDVVVQQVPEESQGVAPENDAINEMMERFNEFERTIHELRQAIEERGRQIEELGRATELITDAVARHLGTPVNGNVKAKPSEQNSPFDTLAKMIRKV